MKLLQFRVKQFRSISDSGWISCSDVTTLVGMNEAGKSNLLLALWKLNPANGGVVNLLADMPRSVYSKARNEADGMVFIEADFSLPSATTKAIAAKCLIQNQEGLEVRVSKDFADHICIEFLNAVPSESISVTSLTKVLDQGLAQVQAADVSTSTLQNAKELAEKCLTEIHEKYTDTFTGLTDILLQEFKTSAKSYSTLPDSPFRRALESVWHELSRLENYFASPHNVEGVKELVVKAMPKFVYYSNYGNLDSEIYLPHAIENMSMSNLTGVAEAKTRTLRVLFEYVGLDPNEILEMGREPTNNQSQELIARSAARKTERQALLHSAQSRLTREFRDWWKQGSYNFDFRADGNYFRIFVSDAQRPEPIELENRSTGLQWFLSFYLIFLVESQDAHANAILLLDEAGHSLHPLAQRDLALFFDNLSRTNQIVHTTQSPFLVDTNHIDRVRAVYMDSDGFTVASEDLRAAHGQANQQGSVYAVHAALGLSVSDILLQGCLPVIVEGVSDQIYLNAIKNWLIQAKMISPGQEIIFAPSGGTAKVKPLSSLLTGREGELVPVILDSDQAGRDLKSTLISGLYSANKQKLITIDEFTQVPDAEVEDLIPIGILDALLEKRLFRDAQDLFTDAYNPAMPLVGQVETFAAQQDINLEKGWKVKLAVGFKNRLLTKSPPTISDKTAAVWKNLFERILAS